MIRLLFMRAMLIVGAISATTQGDDGAATSSSSSSPSLSPSSLFSSRVVNDRCPVMTDEFASPQHEIDFHGSAVRFCCDECKGKFLSDPATYVTHLPHLPAETVAAVVEQSQRQARTEQASRWADRWTRPMLMGLAVVIAVAIAARALFRRRAT